MSETKSKIILIQSAEGINVNCETKPYIREITEKQLKMCTYLQGLEDGVTPGSLPDGAIAHVSTEGWVVQHTTPKSLDVIANFLAAHENDAPVPEDWMTKAVTPLTEADVTLFKTMLATKKVIKDGVEEEVPDEHAGRYLPDLMLASNFINCKNLLHAFAQFFSQQIAAKTSVEIQEYFGKELNATEEMQEQVKAKYPTLF
jgi:hypothetical protein